MSDAKAKTVPVPEANEPAAKPDGVTRARICWGEIQEVLDHHDCHLAPRLGAEPVGQDGSRAMLSATYVVVPNGS